ncbi:hypothetical protein [Mycobacterium marinum]|uniref:hypothetical protein n=1 Tax=Mycobacterium marinum TaxID=1781 RepID=UPI000B96D403|nr:hypothetical protein [Mycobacterium marinum]
MADIREKLAEALAEHYEIAARRFADVLLSLPGIAIVELPEPNYRYRNGDPTWRGDEWSIIGAGAGRIEIHATTKLTAANASELAAALLAAAAASEAGDK